MLLVVRVDVLVVFELFKLRVVEVDLVVDLVDDRVVLRLGLVEL